ncbi:hypothetical protein FQZ97_1177610 [compost metagenome]
MPEGRGLVAPVPIRIVGIADGRQALRNDGVQRIAVGVDLAGQRLLHPIDEIFQQLRRRSATLLGVDGGQHVNAAIRVPDCRGLAFKRRKVLLGQERANIGHRNRSEGNRTGPARVRRSGSQCRGNHAQ